MNTQQKNMKRFSVYVNDYLINKGSIVRLEVNMTEDGKPYCKAHILSSDIFVDLYLETYFNSMLRAKINLLLSMFAGKNKSFMRIWTKFERDNTRLFLKSN